MTVALFDAGDDPAVLARLHAASFPDAWDEKAIAALLATPGTFAHWNDDGFVLARVAAQEGEILTLAVNPPARGKGLGRALLTAALDKAAQMGAQAVFLEVGADNPAALALYAALGFVRVGDRKGYYRGRDALVLRLSLPGNLA